MRVRCIVVKLCLVAKKPSYKDYPKELNTLGDHLRKARLDRGLHQTEVASLLGVAEMSVNAWELNNNQPSAKYTKKIIEFIGYLPKEWLEAPIPLKLRYARLISGKTQAQASAELGLDYTTIQMIEKGARKPSKKSVLVIDAYFDSVATCRQV